MTFASLSTVWGLTGQWRPRLDEKMLEPNDLVHILPPDFLGVLSWANCFASIPHSKVRVLLSVVLLSVVLLQGLGESLAEPLSASTQQVFTLVVRVPCCFSEVI